MAVQAKTGLRFYETKMRDVNAIYGGEISAHHYFRDFFYCDSGMIPWLMIVLEIWELKKERCLLWLTKGRNYFPSSGEINLQLNDPDKAIEKVEAIFEESMPLKKI